MDSKDNLCKVILSKNCAINKSKQNEPKKSKSMSTVEVIKHYQRSIYKSLHNPARLLYCLDRLSKLKITVDYIKTTGIGLTLNGLRKCEGEVGSAASALVTKWKIIVAEEFIDGISNQKGREMKMNEKFENSQGPELNLTPQNQTQSLSCSSSTSDQSVYKDEDKQEMHNQQETTHSTRDNNIADLPHSSKQIKPHKPQSFEAVKSNSSKHYRVSESSDDQNSYHPSNKRKISTSSAEIVIDSSMGASFADALCIINRPSVLKKKPQLLAKLTSVSSKPKHEQKSPKKDKSTKHKDKKAKIEIEAPSLLKTRDGLEPPSDITSDILLHMPSTSQTHSKSSTNPIPKDRVPTLHESISPNFKSKRGHTKVFSGTKIYCRGEVPKLYDLCIRWLQEHIDDLEAIGGVPYYILKPVLERASVEQLLAIEDFNPYLIEDSDELWKIHCGRRFRGRQPEELESWRELFLRSQDEQEAKFEALTKNIKASLEQPGAIKKTKLAFVEAPKKLSKKSRTQTKSQRSINVHKLPIPSLNPRTCIRPIAQIPNRKIPRRKTYEDDPEWLPGNLYTRTGRSKQVPEIKKSIDMIRYDRAKREEDRKRRQKLKKVVDKDHPYSAPSTIPASPAQVQQDHNYL